VRVSKVRMGPAYERAGLPYTLIHTHTHVISHTVSSHLDGCDEVVDLVIKFLRARQQRLRELFQVENKLYVCICVCVCV
jgi:hypothetical protein